MIAKTTPAAGATPPLRWDLICRVIDNLGDAGVLWRLARQLAVEHGQRVRLLLDQPAVLQRLVPAAVPGATVDGVAIEHLEERSGGAIATAPEGGARGSGRDTDVVVTGFHAALPAAYRRMMTPVRPLWINLEYLSAEDWVDRFHGLPSPHADGLIEHFFYPGFTGASGGLLREADLIARRDAFVRSDRERRRFLADLDAHPRDGEALASMFCYPGAPLEALAHELARSSAFLHLLVPEGTAAAAADAADFERASQGHLRITRIPFLPQRNYDRLLWSCDLNFVRGEDSLVRALWSGKPFVWQIYRQADDAHLPKLEAFLQLLPGRLLAGAMRWWNGSPAADSSALVELISNPAQATACLRTVAAQARAPDLTSRLLAFVGVLAARPAAGTGDGES